jgi:hypothetical protein
VNPDNWLDQIRIAQEAAPQPPFGCRGCGSKLWLQFERMPVCLLTKSSTDSAKDSPVHYCELREQLHTPPDTP